MCGVLRVGGLGGERKRGRNRRGGGGKEGMKADEGGGFWGQDFFTGEHGKVLGGKTILRPDFDSEDGPGSCVSVRRLVSLLSLFVFTTFFGFWFCLI